MANKVILIIVGIILPTLLLAQEHLSENTSNQIEDTSLIVRQVLNGKNYKIFIVRISDGIELKMIKEKDQKTVDNKELLKTVKLFIKTPTTDSIIRLEVLKFSTKAMKSFNIDESTLSQKHLVRKSNQLAEAIISQYGASNERRSAFSTYEPNYFIGAMPFGSLAVKDTGEVKFQTSFKYDFSRLAKKNKFYLGITFKAIWDLYQWNKSSPIEEVNFMPTFWYERNFNVHEKEKSGFTLKSLKAGVGHESNGQPDSVNGSSNQYDRSWNKIFVEGFIRWNNNDFDKWSPRYKIKRIEIYPRLWYGFGLASDNNDLNKYYGFSRIVTNISIGGANLKYVEASEYELEIAVRPTIYKNELSELLIGLKIGPWNVYAQSRSLPYFYIQYFRGYGESLIVYNKFQQVIRAGIYLRIS
jgi:phospholipase A1